MIVQTLADLDKAIDLIPLLPGNGLPERGCMDLVRRNEEDPGQVARELLAHLDPSAKRRMSKMEFKGLKTASTARPHARIPFKAKRPVNLKPTNTRPAKRTGAPAWMTWALFGAMLAVVAIARVVHAVMIARGR